MQGRQALCKICATAGVCPEFVEAGLLVCRKVGCVVGGKRLDRGLGQPEGMSWLLGHMGPLDS